MSGWIIVLIIGWVVFSAVRGSKAKQRAQQQRSQQQGRQRRAAGESMVEQQRRLAEQYRSQGGPTRPRPVRRQPGESAVDRREHPWDSAVDRREHPWDSAPAPQPAAFDGRERPWHSAPQPVAAQDFFAAPPEQPDAGAAAAWTTMPSQRGRRTPDPLCAVPEAHLEQPDPVPAAQPLFSRQQLVQGVVMAEVLGPCKARRM